MLFTKDDFNRRAYREARRKPRALTVFDSYHNDSDRTDFLEQYMFLQVYRGDSRIFDDAIHFYYQTLRHEAFVEGEDWKEWITTMVRNRRMIVSRSLRDAPWEIRAVDADAYSSLTKNFSATLPDASISGRYLAGMTVGHVNWSDMNLIAKFENLYIRINTFYSG
ncbi:hypothetical protein [Deinococcus sp.]|uniref:hypothetical protein n=1 Tax=Deinococcus sp. TaxID=47478 RepID=UPI003C7D4C63